MINTKLLNRIKDELEEDLNRFDDDFDLWYESILDYPSNNLKELFKQIPSNQEEKYFENYIFPFMNSLKNQT